MTKLTQVQKDVVGLGMEFGVCGCNLLLLVPSFYAPPLTICIKATQFLEVSVGKKSAQFLKELRCNVTCFKDPPLH